MRTLAEVYAGIEATSKLLVELQQARDHLLAERKAACLSAFDAGISRESICLAHDISYAALSSMLHKNKRTAKTRIVSGLSYMQRVHFGNLTKQGYTPKQARKIAEALAA